MSWKKRTWNVNKKSSDQVDQLTTFLVCEAVQVMFQETLEASYINSNDVLRTATFHVHEQAVGEAVRFSYIPTVSEPVVHNLLQAKSIDDIIV